MQVLMKGMADRKGRGHEKENRKQGSQGCFAVQNGTGDWSLRMHEREQSSTRMGVAQWFLGQVSQYFFHCPPQIANLGATNWETVVQQSIIISDTYVFVTIPVGARLYSLAKPAN